MPRRKGSARESPVMQQFAAAKRAYPDAILFFRMGDFYEMFEDDAVLGARLLDIALTSRNKGQPDEVPMAGVPHHAAHGYVGRLLEMGQKVAICEQMADPSKVKGIVPRQVVRVLTPGTVTDADHLEATVNNWLAAVEVGDARTAVALLDLSTGELRVATVSDSVVAMDELGRASPREVLVSREDALGAAQQMLPRTPVRVDPPFADADVQEALGALAADARQLTPEARLAAARTLRFARDCTPGTSPPVRRIGVWEPSRRLALDATAERHLEVVRSSGGGREATLLAVVDETRTPPGARLLRRRLLAPLVDVERIRRRHDAVEHFVIHSALRGAVAEALASVGDLERLAVRASLGEATPRDLGALRDGLGAAARVVSVLSDTDSAAERDVLGLPGTTEPPVDVVTDLRGLLERALVERPPVLAKEGAVFRDGFDAQLDEYGELKRSGTERIVALESALRESTGISGLKVKFTRVFGWYVEVSRTQASRAPRTWRRKQTVATGERFTTDDLDELAEKIASAEERHRERELALLSDLVARAREASGRVADLAARLARWDVSVALAEVAHRFDYCRPTVDDSDVLHVVDGRHAVVERLAAAGRFVPNDTSLQASGERLWIVTGPNMAGKSTLLRQVALIVVLAQAGSFVPAASARIGIVDRVLSRVGASDDLARGDSTFMVEMKETAAILAGATPRSLVILDEIGRGTSTFDGLAIAWAVAEHLDVAIGCRAMFATHYHELTSLADQSPHVVNTSVAAREIGDEVVFLHRLARGAASRSYGIAVARLAGLPESVLARARAVLATLEGAGAPSGGTNTPPRLGAAQGQLDLFAGPAAPAEFLDVLETLRATDLDRMTPLDALTLLAKLKNRL